MWDDVVFMVDEVSLGKFFSEEFGVSLSVQFQQRSLFIFHFPAILKVEYGGSFETSKYFRIKCIGTLV
jgi:hypothetical protein